MAANGGNAEAQNAVGSILQERRQFNEAREWFEKAATQSNALGTNNLAYLYDLGLGVPQDRLKAKQLYIAAAKLGWGEAMWNLAIMAALGQAGPVDKYYACVWTQRALLSKQVDRAPLRANAERGMHELESKLNSVDIDRCKWEAKGPIE